VDSEFILTIYPDIPDYQGDTEQLVSLFKKCKLVGIALDNKRYATGEKFLSLLTFMGCSPNIELEPQDNKPYCYIELKTPSQMQFISGKNTKYPLCSQCKEKLKKLTCTKCDNRINPTIINWRKSAFVANCWIVIANIYELEAIPNDELLELLANETGIKWKYAYLRQAKEINLNL